MASEAGLRFSLVIPFYDEVAQLTETDAIGLHGIWYLIGFGGQIAFGSRFFVQWLASERARRSVEPKVFWYLSLLGSLLLLTYAIRIGDAVFITVSPAASWSILATST